MPQNSQPENEVRCEQATKIKLPQYICSCS